MGPLKLTHMASQSSCMCCRPTAHPEQYCRMTVQNTSVCSQATNLSATSHINNPCEERHEIGPQESTSASLSQQAVCNYFFLIPRCKQPEDMQADRSVGATDRAGCLSVASIMMHAVRVYCKLTTLPASPPLLSTAVKDVQFWRAEQVACSEPRAPQVMVQSGKKGNSQAPNRVPLIPAMCLKTKCC